VMDMINMYSKQRGRVIEYREILYGYHRLNPLYGADYILDMLLMYKKYRGRKMTVPVRRHVYLQQQFTDLEIREIYEGEEVASPLKDSTEVAVEDLPDGKPGMPGVIKDAFESGLLKIGESFPFVLSSHLPKKTPTVKDKLINFILPLSGRIETFKRFIAVFEDVCLKNDEKVSLIVVVFPHEKEITSSNETIKLMNNLQRRYPDVRLLSILVNEQFARAMALEMGAAQCAEDDLMFFIDVDMVFTSSALHRIRTNTIQGKQVYFPIVYSEFDPTVVYKTAGFSTSPNHFLVNRDSGYWRQFGFGIASMYKSDLKRVGGFDISIHGWGKEDVELFDKFVAAAKNITIFRAADPSLVHVFHIVDCDPKLDESQLRMCRGTRADTYGGVFQLAQFIYSHKDILLFARNKNKHEPPS
ncbi:Hexosyltransferase, partial [Gryllus bimaculatus]